MDDTQYPNAFEISEVQKLSNLLDMVVEDLQNDELGVEDYNLSVTKERDTNLHSKFLTPGPTTKRVTFEIEYFIEDYNEK